MPAPKLLLPQAMLDPATLIPHPGNPRVHADLTPGMREFGLYRAVVVNKRTGQLVAGHGTVDAFMAENPGEPIQVSYIDVDQETADRILIWDNRSGDLSGYDDRLLAELLGSLPDLDYTGYEPGDLEELLKDIDGFPPAGPIIDPNMDADEVPDPPTDPVTKVGDIWHLGQHIVWCGDCTGVIPPLIPTAVDLILTDPPYCSGGFQEAGKAIGSVGTDAAHKQIANDRLSTRGYQALMRASLNGVAADLTYIFTDWRMWPHLFDVVESSGFGTRSMIVWDKGTPGMGLGWRAQHELILFSSKIAAPWDRHSSGSGNVIQSSRTGNPLHTTQKPVDLVQRLLDNTPTAKTVWDPFGGSGTTLVGAHATGRTCYTAELDPAYVDVICARWEKLTGQPATRPDGEPFPRTNTHRQ